MFLKYALAAAMATTSVSSDTNQETQSDPYADMIFIPPMGEDVNLSDYLNKEEEEKEEETPTLESEEHILPIVFQHCTMQEQLAGHVATLRLKVADTTEDAPDVTEEQGQQIIGLVSMYFQEPMEQVAANTAVLGESLPAERVEGILTAFMVVSELEQALERQTGLDIMSVSITYERQIVEHDSCKIENLTPTTGHNIT